jgi:tRNA dimethylallyltransferase
MQVYRGMDIGTAKPGAALRARLPHHLIDIRDPSEQFNAGEFTRLALEAIAGITARGKLPVVSGGAGFYLQALLQGLPEAPPSDAAVRGSLREELLRGGPQRLHAELAERDRESAARIHPNDEYRLLRALEVCRVSGRPLTAFSRRPPQNIQFLVAGLERERADLYARIGQRCEDMFNAGLEEEVRALFEKGYTPADPGLRAIGYREFFVENGDGSFSLNPDTAAVRENIARNSRHYAKRQITWFKKVPDVLWLPAQAGFTCFALRNDAPLRERVD